MVSLLVGIVYFNQRLDQDGVMNINGALFIFLTNMTFQNVFAVINVKFICLYKNYIKIKREVMPFMCIYVRICVYISFILCRFFAQNYRYFYENIETACIVQMYIFCVKRSQKRLFL